MELRHLQYLLTVAEEGSFTRAAEKLYISQPALSQQVRQLEDELGALLLDRTGKGIRLTAAGDLFSRYARKIFCQIEEAKLALHELEGMQRGSLTVGTVQTVNAYLIPQVVADFAEAYPAVSLKIDELPASELENALDEGNLQLAISFVPPANNTLEWETLFNEQLVLIVSKEHELAGRESLNISDLQNVPLVLLSKNYCTRRLAENSAQEAGIEFKVAAEMNTISTILKSIQSTKMGTILPRLALAAHDTEKLAALSLQNPTPIRTVGLLWRRNSYRSIAARIFADIVKKYTNK